MQPILFTVSVDPRIDPAELVQKIAKICEHEFAAQMAETLEDESASVFTAPIVDAPAEAQVIAIISRLFDAYDRAPISPEAWTRIGAFAVCSASEKRVRTLKGAPTAPTQGRGGATKCAAIS